jgi:hypothetical protein
MESATFRKWLVEQGCRFDRHELRRREGHVMVTVHREGRKAEVLSEARARVSTRVWCVASVKSSALIDPSCPVRRVVSDVVEVLS